MFFKYFLSLGEQKITRDQLASIMTILEENYFSDYDTPVDLSNSTMEDLSNTTQDLINMASPSAKTNMKERGFDWEVSFSIYYLNFSKILMIGCFKTSQFSCINYQIENFMTFLHFHGLTIK